MRDVTIHLHAHDLTPAETYRRLSDFARYPAMTDTVRQVVVDEPSADGSVVSTWTVKFRSGLLHWTERDVLDPVAQTITFTQLRGDFHTFEGQWRLSAAQPGGTEITFDATFDLGMASLEAILDPIAEAALRENILVIVQGLVGRVDELVPLSALETSP
jgi:ribosome-associated toxin RatA of RatAB toxin-antitoxin module